MKKNGKTKFKWKYILIILLFIILFLGIDFIVHWFINRSFDTDPKVSDEIGHTLPITYLIMDESNTPENLDSTQATYEYSNYILYSTVGYVELVKDGDYYVSKFDNMNPILKEKIASYSFSHNDITGNVIDDAIFSENENIKIPSSYYENFKEGSKEPIQMEVVVRTTKEKLKNVEIKVNFENNSKKNKTISVDGTNVTTSFSIMGYKKGKYLQQKDIAIYINGSNQRVFDEKYLWESNSSTIQLAINPVLINEITVKIKSQSLIEKILNIKNVFAETASLANVKSSGTIKAITDEKIEGKTFDIKLNTWYFWPSCQGGDNACKYDDVVMNAYNDGDSYLYGECDESVCSTSNSAYEDFVVKFVKDEEYGNGAITFVNDVYSLLICGDHTLDAGDANGERNYTLTVIAKGSNYIIVLLTGKTGDYSWQGGQIPTGYLKFSWDDTPTGKIKVQKKVLDKDNDEVNESDKKFTIGLYQENKDNEKELLATKNVAAGKTITFSNLALGTYYVRELYCDDNNYICDTKFHKVTLNESEKENEKDVYIDTTLTGTGAIKNYIKYYCFKVQKKDSEDNNCAVEGIDFKFEIEGSSFSIFNPSTNSTTNTSTKTTNSSGRVAFNYIKYPPTGSVSDSGITGNLNRVKVGSVREASSNGTRAKRYCEGEEKAQDIYYSIDDPQSIDIIDTDLVAMDRNSRGEYSCPDTEETNEKAKSFSNTSLKFCTAIKKVDSNTKDVIEGAKYTLYTTDGNCKSETNPIHTAITGKNGIATFALGELTDDNQEYNKKIYYARETTAPAGYALDTACHKVTLSYATSTNSCVSIAESLINDGTTYEDTKLLLNWYKVTEKINNIEKDAPDAEFTVQNSNNKYVIATGLINHEDANGNTKQCYTYSSTTDNKKDATTFVSGDEGSVCIVGIPIDTYTVTETSPAPFHTFGTKKVQKITVTEDSTKFLSKDDNNKFVNYPTEFVFTKSVSPRDGDEKIIVNGKEKTLSELTTEELKNIEFNIYDNQGKALTFIKTSEGTYEYIGNGIDKPTGIVETAALHLGNDKKIKVKHLPIGTYYIKEKTSKSCDSNSSFDSCIGYYYPNYANEKGQPFTITECSSTNATSCSSHVVATQSLINYPTSIEFTKKDFYNYYDQSDINESDVKFEDDKERSDFDKIVFKLKDANGKYLTLKKVGDYGDCTSDKSYSEYRYVSSDQSDTNGTELHTCGGHIRITNLCRGNKYTVEEISVPDDSVYVKEDTDSTPTKAEYTIPCTSETPDKTTTTNQIEDKPTRVRFEKRDSKYGYLINDETTTFQVYKCKKDEECHPSDYKTVEERESAGMTLVKFNPRVVISNDEEDPTDAAGLTGVEVYRKMSDSDAKTQKYVTDLHPYNGILVLRYMESGYNYVLLETVAPKNYTLPIGRNAETKFTVTNTTVSVEEVDVQNKPTSLIIRKYSDDGNLLEGAEFKVYEGTTCDANLSAMNQPKTLLKLKTVRDGVYENRPEKDTDTVLTCTDKEDAKCSNIDIELGINDKNERVEIKQGEALVQYLEYGKCYIIEEVKAPKGYSLPENDEDRFTMVTIPKNTQYVSDTYKTLINKPTPFTFYKYDEYNNLIDGAEFKLQKLDDNKKYHDITVTKEETETGVYYKADDSTDNKVITTKNGSATVYYLEEGQYRIVETKPAPGKELNKNPNVATFFVDDSGNVYGNSIIVNKAKTETIELKSSANAELVVSIQTGQRVIKYGLIIMILLLVIVSLMIILKMYNKKLK